jgi:hypothetical protein
MHRTLVLTLALGLLPPAALSAQEPPPANPVTQSFRAFGTRYGDWLAAAFDSIPAATYGYKPTPAQQSVGYIAQHLEDANYQLCARFGGAERTVTARDSLADTVKAAWPKDTLVARLKASLAYCDSALATATDAALAEEVTVGPPSAPRKIARVRFMIGYVTDLAEHYSQIASYMRLNGMLPPSALPRGR